MTYQEKLKDPRWEKRKNDYKLNYFMFDTEIECEVRCEGCGAIDNLEVHHKRYIKGLEPWDYKDDDLAVLCRGCHQTYHDNKNLLISFLTNHRLFYSYEFSLIIKILKNACSLNSGDISKLLDYSKKLADNDE
jgi:5-methylcytosine-specific restriction endonuclease McrA